MKKVLLTSILLLVALSASAFSQTEQEQSFESLLEADAKKDLAVAWHYFKMRKAYKGVLYRTEVTMAAHPEFSKIDEVIYLTGMSSYYLYLGKGSQKIVLKQLSESEQERFSKPKLKEDAEAYLTQYVDKYPDGKYIKKAKKALKKLSKS